MRRRHYVYAVAAVLGFVFGVFIRTAADQAAMNPPRPAQTCVGVDLAGHVAGCH